MSAMVRFPDFSGWVDCPCTPVSSVQLLYPFPATTRSSWPRLSFHNTKVTTMEFIQYLHPVLWWDYHACSPHQAAVLNSNFIFPSVIWFQLFFTVCRPPLLCVFQHTRSNRISLPGGSYPRWLVIRLSETFGKSPLSPPPFHCLLLQVGVITRRHFHAGWCSCTQYCD